jgi:hypothetical protein
MSVISAHRKWKQRDRKFKASLGYIMRPFFQKKKKKNPQTKSHGFKSRTLQKKTNKQTNKTQKTKKEDTG